MSELRYNDKNIGICIPVWGDEHWEKFKSGLLRDLFEQESIPWLVSQGNQITFFIFTNQQGFGYEDSLPKLSGVTYDFEDINELKIASGGKYNTMDLSHQISMAKMRKLGGGILAPLCADAIITKGFFKNCLSFWQPQSYTVFAMPGVALAERKFCLESWHQAEAPKQVNMLLDAFDKRMYARHIQADSFWLNCPSLLLSGNENEGFVISGMHWHPVFIKVYEGDVKNASFYKAQIDQLQFTASDLSDEDILFCSDSNLAAIGSLSDDDLNTRYNMSEFDPFQIASWILRGHPNDPKTIARILHSYHLKRSGKAIAQSHVQLLEERRLLISEAWQSLIQSEKLADFYRIQGINNSFSPISPNTAITWHEFVRRKIDTLLAESDQPIYLYGPGGHTDALLYFTKLGCHLSGIFKPSEQEAPKTLKGLPILDDTDIEAIAKEQKIVVIISSVSYQDVIYERLCEIPNVQLFRLYRANHNNIELFC